MNHPSKPIERLVLTLPVSGVAFWDRLVRELGALGNTVEVWAELPEEAYRLRGGLIGALTMRARVWGLFPLRVLWRMCRHRAARRGAVLVTTTPFYLPAAAGLLARLMGGRVVHLLYDLYPDQLVIAGKVRRDSVVSRVLAWSTRIALRHCAATVFLGAKLKQVAEARYGPARRGAIIEVGGDGELFASSPEPQSGPVRVLYAGNFGYAHDFETLLALLREPLPSGVELTFHASGAGYERLKGQRAYFGRERVVFAGPLSTVDWARTMAGAQVALVTMRPGAEEILFPSKTYSSMLAGQAILAICPPESDLAATVREAKAGWVIEPGDAEGLRRLLEQLAESPSTVLEARQRSQAFARDHFEMRVIARKWTRLLQELTRAS